MIRFLPSFLIVTLAAGFVLAASAAAPNPLATLRPEHPRLIATADDWARLKERLAGDSTLASYHEGILTEARALLKAWPVQRKMTGRRLLAVSRTLVHRITTLGYAWQMTGDRAFAERAEVEMLAAAAFRDWNPSHFLDVAEATAALAIGYDWCFDALSTESREEIRNAIVSHGIAPGMPTRGNGWQRSRNNWNQVCLGGLTLGALAIADEHPEIARHVLSLARERIGNGLAPYAPDGVYPEGPSYWAYGTSYQVLMIAALESALGTDLGLAARDGFLESAGFVLQGTGPGGRYYNFADGREGGGLNGAMFWFARKLGDPGLLMFNWRHLASEKEVETSRFSPLVPLWWPETGTKKAAPSLPLRWNGHGENPLGVFRESWTDPGALYLAFKGGAAELNHAHMDAGSFILEADGVRWGIDLGLQEYESLESKGVDLWNRSQDSQRWQVYRLGNFSHSTLTIEGKHHRVDGHATFTHFSDSDANPGAILDLSPVFEGQATSVRRGFRILPGRRVLVQDELTGLKPGVTVRWQMPTRATVSTDGATAILAQDAKKFHAKLLSPGVTFATEPASPPDDGFNAPNPEVSLLFANAVAPESGTLRISVVLSPGGSGEANAEVASLDSWFADDARVAAPKPLYRDPVYDGAADPSIVYDRANKRWRMFYTNRRANAPGLTAVTWVHGTPIGIAESVDGSTWTYAGDAEFPKDIPGTDVEVPTYWAPAVVDDGETYHMFLSIVPGIFEDWQHPRNIVHLTSSDLRRWKYESTLPLVTDKVIDAGVLRLPDGTWRLWYNNERDGKRTYYADSPDLYTWTDRGSANLPRDRGEAPLPFFWKGRYWMLVDLLGNIGLGAYRSDDALNWERQPASLLDVPGKGEDDQNGGHHPEVVINGDRAFLFYFVHPGVAADSDEQDTKRSSIQVTELKLSADGWLECDRDAPTHIRLSAP